MCDDRDAIVRVDAVTICGTDLHILKGDVPETEAGRILGHEAVGTVVETGRGVEHGARATVCSSRASPPAHPAGSSGKGATGCAPPTAGGCLAT